MSRDKIKRINNQTRKNRQHNYFRNFATNKRDEWEEIPVKEIELVWTAFDVLKLIKKKKKNNAAVLFYNMQ